MKGDGWSVTIAFFSAILESSHFYKVIMIEHICPPVQQPILGWQTMNAIITKDFLHVHHLINSNPSYQIGPLLFILYPPTWVPQGFQPLPKEHIQDYQDLIWWGILARGSEQGGWSLVWINENMLVVVWLLMVFCMK